MTTRHVARTQSVPEWEPCPLPNGDVAITVERLAGAFAALHRRTLRFLCALEVIDLDVDELPGMGGLLADLGRIDGLLEAGRERLARDGDALALARWTAIGRSASDTLTGIRSKILLRLAPPLRDSIASAEEALRSLELREA